MIYPPSRAFCDRVLDTIRRTEPVSLRTLARLLRMTNQDQVRSAVDALFKLGEVVSVVTGFGRTSWRTKLPHSESGLQ